MPSITQSSIDAVKQVDIVDIISDYIELKKSGANFKACCPFHSEKTPSFVVSPSKQIYHCFSCNVGGDGIKFVQEYAKKTFVEAVEGIASNYGVFLEYEKGSEENSNRKALVDINEYYLTLITSKLRDKDKEYLFKRGFKSETIESWGLGFTPRSADDVISFFASNMKNIPLVLEAGVLSEYEGKIYNLFSARLTFPIYDTFGALVGFAGRSLQENPKLKYKNSKDSPLFSKSKILFGLDKARATAIRKGWLIVIEGQFDTMLCHQEGIVNSCGTQGTALTSEHVKMIKRMGVKVLLGFDGDKAGIASALKASSLLSEAGIDGGVAIFKEGDDPADMVASSRIEELKEVFKKGTKTKLVTFVLEQIAKQTDFADPFSKKDGVAKCNDFLNSLDVVVAGEYRAMVATLFSVALEVLPNRALEITGMSHEVAVPTATLEDSVLYTLSTYPWYIDDYDEKLDANAFHKKDLALCVLNFSTKEIEESGIALLDGVGLMSKEALSMAIDSLNKRYFKHKIQGASVASVLGMMK